MPAAQDFLNRLQIASPCPASWAEMSGDERARFCATCEKHVYDFSKMTAAEGMALIREKEGQVCARLWRRADGTVITADCPVGAMRLANRRRARLPWAAAACLSVVMANIACAPKRAPATAPAPIAAQTQRARPEMVTTYDYSGPVPAATVTICDWVAGANTVNVGFLVNTEDDSYHLNFDSPAAGRRMTSQDWENLPLR